MSAAAFPAHSRRRALHVIKRTIEGGATLYTGVFGNAPRPALVPVPSFEDLEPRRSYADIAGLAGSILLHLLLLALAIALWNARPAPPPERPVPPGVDVTLVFEPGGGAVREGKPVAALQAAKAPKPVLRASAAPRRDEAPAPPASVSGAGPVAEAPVTPVVGRAVEAPPVPAAAMATAQPAARGDAPVPAEETRWEGSILERLARKKRYPAKAEHAGQEDVVMVRLTLDRDGRLLHAEITRSKGIEALDHEVLSLVERASPYPKPPASVTGGEIRLSVPIEFVLRRARN